MRLIDLTGNTYEKLRVLRRANHNKNGQVVWVCQCECGKIVNKIGTYLKTGDTKSCGCYKNTKEVVNLRTKYDAKRVDGIATQLFKGIEPRKDSSTGYRGVSKYYTRKSKMERYRASITVAGEKYFKSGFLTPEDAYYKGRLLLEKKYLPST